MKSTLRKEGGRRARAEGLGTLSAAALFCAAAFTAAPVAAQDPAPGPAPHGHGSAAPSAPAWTDLPMLKAVPSDRMGVTLIPVNIAPAESVSLTAPNGESWPLPLENGKAKAAPRNAVGNYHWAVAQQVTADGLRIAATAPYFSNPGPAPTRMLVQSQAPLAQAPLEVIPDPLPREHWRWRAGETYAFILRAAGQPLVGAKVQFQGSQGARQSLVSDGTGRVFVQMPKDFRPIDQRPAEGHSAGGHGARLSAEFVLAVTADLEGRRVVSAFNGVYEPAALDGKSIWGGAGFAVLGGLCALPLLRRRRPAPEGV